MKQVLVVDDDPDILDAIASILEGAYQVTCAQNGAIALDLMSRYRFDAVVLDLMMPVMDGAALLRLLRDRGSRVPVIIASAGTDLERITHELGATDCLHKPFEVRELEDMLGRILDDPSGGAELSEDSGPRGPGSAGGSGNGATRHYDRRRQAEARMSAV